MTRSIEQTAESREQRAETRYQRAETRDERAESRDQRAEREKGREVSLVLVLETLSIRAASSAQKLLNARGGAHILTCVDPPGHDRTSRRDASALVEHGRAGRGEGRRRRGRGGGGQCIPCARSSCGVA